MIRRNHVLAVATVMFGLLMNSAPAGATTTTYTPGMNQMVTNGSGQASATESADPSGAMQAQQSATSSDPDPTAAFARTWTDVWELETFSGPFAPGTYKIVVSLSNVNASGRATGAGFADTQWDALAYCAGCTETGSSPQWIVNTDPSFGVPSQVHDQEYTAAFKITLTQTESSVTVGADVTSDADGGRTVYYSPTGPVNEGVGSAQLAFSGQVARMMIVAPSAE